MDCQNQVCVGSNPNGQCNTTVTVTVADIDNRPKAGLFVYVYHDSTQVSLGPWRTDSAGVVKASVPPGDYRFRVSDGHNIHFSSDTNDCSVPTCTSDRITTAVPVTVILRSVSGIPLTRRFMYAFQGTTVTAFNPGITDSKGQAFPYVMGGSYRFRFSDGSRVYFSGNTDHCTVVPISIDPSGGCRTVVFTTPTEVSNLLATPDTVVAGASVNVSWSGYASSATAGDQLRLYVAGAPDSAFLAQHPTGGAASGIFAFPLSPTQAPDTYEARYYRSDGVLVTASNPFVVTASPCAGAADGTVCSAGTSCTGAGTCHAGVCTLTSPMGSCPVASDHSAAPADYRRDPPVAATGPSACVPGGSVSDPSGGEGNPVPMAVSVGVGGHVDTLRWGFVQQSPEFSTAPSSVVGSVSTCGSLLGGTRSLQIRRIHRPRAEDWVSSFGPAVFSNFDAKLAIRPQGGVQNTVVLFNPDSDAPPVTFAEVSAIDGDNTVDGRYSDTSSREYRSLTLLNAMGAPEPNPFNAIQAVATRQNGEQLTFEVINVQGTGATELQARLTALKDRNANALTVTYRFAASSTDTQLGGDRKKLWQINGRPPIPTMASATSSRRSIRGLSPKGPGSRPSTRTPAGTRSSPRPRRLTPPTPRSPSTRTPRPGRWRPRPIRSQE
jgi:hypothetical protein